MKSTTLVFFASIAVATVGPLAGQSISPLPSPMNPGRSGSAAEWMRQKEVDRQIDRRLEDRERMQDAQRMLEEKSSSALENQTLVGNLLKEETDPNFREFARQKLNAAGPMHPITGVYMSGTFKSKTPAQAIEVLRGQFKSGGVLIQGATMATGLPPRSTNGSTSTAATMPPTAAEVEAAKLEVRRKYPDFENKNSALSKKYSEIYGMLEQDHKEFLKLSPVSQMQIIADLAAREVGVSPVR